MRENMATMDVFSFRKIAFVISILGLSAFIGLVIALDPALGVKLAIPVLAPIFLLVFWNLPAAKSVSYKLPHLLLGAYLFSAIVWPSYGFVKISSFPALSPTKILYVLLLLVWSFRMFTVAEMRQRLSRRFASFKSISVAFLFFFLWRILSVPLSDEVFFAAKGVFEDIFVYLGMFLITLSLIRDRKDAERMLQLLFFATACVALIGCYESVVKKGVYTSLVFIDESQMSINMVEALREKLREGVFRVQASFDHPLTFGEFLMLSVPVGFGLARLSSASRGILCFTPVILAAMYSAFATGSRAALGGIVGALFITLALLVFRFAAQNRRDPRAGIIWLAMPLVIFSAIGVLYFAKALVAGNTVETAGSSYARLGMLINALPHIASNPLIGHGAGAAVKYVGILAGSGVYTVDNYYLTVAVDNGLPAMLALMFALAAAALAAFRLALHPDARYATLAAGLCASILIFMLFKSILSIAGNMLFIGFLLAILLSLLDDAKGIVDTRPGTNQKD